MFTAAVAPICEVRLLRAVVPASFWDRGSVVKNQVQSTEYSVVWGSTLTS